MKGQGRARTVAAMEKTMTIDGAIDCDIHPGVPNIKALLPYMSDFWRSSFVVLRLRGWRFMAVMHNP